MGATLQGTQAYFQHHPLRVPQGAPGPRMLGKTGFMVSPVGFGGYRVDLSEPRHREALRQALLSGCNLIDTSANYGDGASEALVGEVLGELIGQGRLHRDQIVVVTKAGYIQGKNLELARARLDRGDPFPEVVEYSPECWHCISPEFLEDQIGRSLERLKLSRIDVLLLHNPEYFLKHGGDHREYYRRIKTAFEHLEKEAARGRIQYYGISSNTFPDPRDSGEYTSLEAVHALACEVSAENHFAVVEFPFNLYEPAAVLEENNSGKSVARYAHEHRIGTLANRPFNAFVEGRLLRLADFPAHEGEEVALDLRSALQEAMNLETQYPARERIPANRIAWGHIIRENFKRLSDIDTWRNVLAHQIQPSVDEAIEQLAEEPAYRAWVNDYQKRTEALLHAMTAYLEAQAWEDSTRTTFLMETVCPELKTSPSLSQKAIRAYLSFPGIDCILVGMRQTQYVSDSLSLQPALNPEKAEEMLRSLAQ